MKNNITRILVLCLFVMICAGAVSAATSELKSPNDNINSGWNNPARAYTSDNNRATASSQDDIVKYYNFGFSILTGAIITGIEVQVEGYNEGGSTPRQAEISLSWNGGTSYTSGGTGLKTTNVPTSSDGISTLGGSSDTWGRTWASSNFNNANFRVKLDTISASSGNDLLVDHVQAKVYYTLCGDGVTEGTEQCDGGACCNADCTFKSQETSCTDGLYCNGDETCDGSGNCQAGTQISCSANDLSGIATCDNIPDGNSFTWDSRNPFTSTCDEGQDTCTTGDGTITHTGNDNDGDGYASTCGDCDDNNAAIKPGATELCDGVDNDCNAQTLDGFDESWFNQPISCGVGACASTGNFVCQSGSKTDTCAPGTPSAEVCDGLDNDCDGSTQDDGVDEAWYNQETICGLGVCSATGNYICSEGLQQNTCTPSGPLTEVCEGSFDEDCDGSVDEDCECIIGSTLDCGIDEGECQHGTQTCDDNGQWGECIGNIDSIEESCDGLDNDCDGVIDNGVQTRFYEDRDGDGFGDLESYEDACTQPQGFVSVSDSVDCDDNDQATYPNADDNNCDGVDNDCDQVADDGYVPDESCFLPGICAEGNIASSCTGGVEAQCVTGLPTGDDTDCNGIDEDCDQSNDEHYVSVETECGEGYCYSTGEWICVDGQEQDTCIENEPIPFYQDSDRDFYGNTQVSQISCTDPEDYVIADSDCDDTNADINPSATEICDGIDNNCVGLIDENWVCDITAPVTSFEISPESPNGNNDFYTSYPEITLTCNDEEGGSGCGERTIYYKWDDAEEFTEESSSVASLFTEDLSDGEHTLYYYSEDNAGNFEEPNSFTLKLDRNVPYIQKAGIKATSKNTIEITFSEDLDNEALAIADFAVYRNIIDDLEVDPIEISSLSEENGVVTLTLASDLQDGDNPWLETNPLVPQSIKDMAGNEMSENLHIEVIDDIDPVIANNDETLVTTISEDVEFNAEASDIFSEVEVDWDFGDDSIGGTGTEVTHAYITDGVYTVTSTATDSYGNTATDVTKVIVGEASFTDTGASDVSLQFVDTPAGLFSLEVKESDTTNEGTSGFDVGGKFFEINSDLVDGTFSVTLTFHYEDVDNDGIVDGTSISETVLDVYYFDGTSWTVIPNPVRDPVADTITVTVDHFTLFGLFSPTPAPAPSSSGSSGGGHSGGSSSNCAYSCAAWGECINGKQTRTCTPNIYCDGSSNNKALTERTCETVSSSGKTEETTLTENTANEQGNQPTQETVDQNGNGITGAAVTEPSGFGAHPWLAGLLATAIIGGLGIFVYMKFMKK